MVNEVSIFIMDVSRSSKISNGRVLSRYLESLSLDVKNWCKDTVPVQISHRAGDELVVAVEGYSTAYTIAFYISRLWKFPEQRPYFGITFGDIEDDLKSIDLNTWIHPLMKQARKANDELKKEHPHPECRFQLLPVLNENHHPASYNSFETLINSNLQLQQELIDQQTDIQSVVCALYLILGKQNKVSEHLGRTTATISHHMKQGKTTLILSAFHHILCVLESLEKKEQPPIKQLHGNIRSRVTHQLDYYFPKERS